MKHGNFAIIRRTCIACAMIAAAPLGGAQTPSAAPKTPAAASAPEAAPAPTAVPPAAPSVDQISYLFGLTFGEQLHHFGITDQISFDALTRGTPATFSVNGVIPGWQEALVLMKPGAKWQLFVPPELAYGANPQRGIPGGSLLIFEVELVSVKPSGTPAAPSLRPDAKPAPQSH
jgi:hypothetical protein